MKLGVVFLRREGERAIRVTPPDVVAASGGMDSRWLVIQVVRSGQSDLELVGVNDRRHRVLPARVNTRAWEWRGSISGPWLLFGRFASTYQIALYNLDRGDLRILDSVGGHGAYAEPGQVNGRYAVWAGCPDNFCTIYRYDIQTGKRLRITTAYDLTLYAPSVARNGDVYYGHARRGCGSDVALMRYRPGIGSRLIRRLPQGWDMRFTNTAQVGDHQRVLFDGGRCPPNFDIFAIEDRTSP